MGARERPWERGATEGAQQRAPRGWPVVDPNEVEVDLRGELGEGHLYHLTGIAGAVRGCHVLVVAVVAGAAWVARHLTTCRGGRRSGNADGERAGISERCVREYPDPVVGVSRRIGQVHHTRAVRGAADQGPTACGIQFHRVVPGRSRCHPDLDRGGIVTGVELVPYVIDGSRSIAARSTALGTRIEGATCHRLTWALRRRLHGEQLSGTAQVVRGWTSEVAYEVPEVPIAQGL